mgnify:FL=1
MRIHVTYTGGTIGMVDSPNGLVPGADLKGWLYSLIAGTELEGRVSLTELDPLIDSSNATPESWQAIIDDLRAHREGADSFVVLHGTDTMSYSSAALSYALVGFDRPVVFTGAQYPLGDVGSDAAGNVAGALRAAASGRTKGVSLFFGHHLLAGNRVTKTSSWSFEGFASPSVPPLARTGAPWRWYATDEVVSPTAGPEPAASGASASGGTASGLSPSGSAASGTQASGAKASLLEASQVPADGVGCAGGAEEADWRNPAPYARHDVVVLDLAPGISSSRLEALLTPRPEAVLLRAYGVGNVPAAEPGLAEVLERTIADGVPVVVASQCHQAQVFLGHYEAGDAIARAGAVGAGDMTLEAVYSKIVFLLSQGLRGNDLATWIGRPIAGELTLPTFQ